MDFLQFKHNFSLELDNQQENAVQAVDGPVLLLAVPGSGKTTVLVSRIGYMCFVRGILPEQILTMTYTVSAARDMRERCASVFGQELAHRLEFRTINGVCSRIIRLYEYRMGRKAFQLLENIGQQTNLVNALYQEQSGEFATESITKSLLTAITYAKNKMLRQDELDQLEIEGIQFSGLFYRYNQALRDRRLMDYDDQMVYALQIIRQYPTLLGELQSRYCYLCVDEAQDTSKIQHQLVRLLAGNNKNLFMVGDEDQSIYGFRAAEPQELTQFQTWHPGAKILYLERNYRSTKEIVSAADRLIRHNTDRFPKQMQAVREKGGGIEAIWVYDRKKQYSRLLEIAKNCKIQTAVLYRDHESALPLIDLLERAGIPYQCRRTEGTFFTSRVVRDITDMIQFAMNPYDGELFFKIYYKLGAGISKALARQAVLLASESGSDILDCICSLEEASPWTKKQCAALSTHFSHLLQERADKAIYRIVHFMGYGDYMEQHGIDAQKADILEVLGGAAELTPPELLDRLNELRNIIQNVSEKAGECPFILSTIHSSKGLEYDRVILMDVLDGVFPKTPPPDQNAHPEERSAYEEERRLFYVGMTRAKNKLSLVRFQKPGLSSAFASELFPVQNTSARKGITNLHIKPVPSADCISASAVQIQAGVRLVHKTFGAGTVSAKSGDIISVSFDSGIDKRLSLSTALRSGQISLL